VTFWQKNIGAKAVCKMLMKSTKGQTDEDRLTLEMQIETKAFSILELQPILVLKSISLTFYEQQNNYKPILST